MESLKDKRDRLLIEFIRNNEFNEIVSLLEKILMNKSFTPRLSIEATEPHRIIAGIYNILHQRDEIALRNKYAIQVIALYETEVRKEVKMDWVFELLESISLMEPRVSEVSVVVNHFVEKKLKNKFYGSVELHCQLLAVLCHANYINSNIIRDEISSVEILI
jgi:hypothetical protein